MNDPVPVVVKGFVRFCAKLSPSFATFTIQQTNSDNELVDIVVTRNTHNRNPDTLRNTKNNYVPLQDIIKEVERCMDDAIEVKVNGYLPYEQCSCSKNCPHLLLHCWNVNDLKIVEDRDQEPLFLCHDVNSTKAPPPPPMIPPPDDDDSDIIIHQNGKKQRRKNTKNRGRAARFVELLIDILGKDRLKPPSYLSSPGSNHVGVLDVAGGGSGGITVELSLRRGMPSIVIDPRPVKLNKTQRSILKFRSKNREKVKHGMPISHTANVLFERFKDWKPSQMQMLFNEDFVTEEGHRLLSQCVAVVGMHPDEATDSIIELAMRYNKPWMLCPCCVFPRTFNRVLNGDKPVRTYKDLCEYIKSIDPGNVQEVTLDFEGRNKVYYWLPKGYTTKQA